MTDKNLSIGVDIGARHVQCAALDLDRGEIMASSDSRLSLDSFADAGTILATWARALEGWVASLMAGGRAHSRARGAAPPGRGRG